MKRKIFLSSLLIFLVLSFFRITDKVETSPTFSLKDVVDRGIISTKICGTWTFSGYSLNLTMTSLVDYSVVITIAIGRILLPSDEEYQSMVIGDVYTIELEARETKRVLLFGFCIESGDSAPDETICFSLGEVNEALIPVLSVIKDRGIPDVAPKSLEAYVQDMVKGFEAFKSVLAAQMAIWAVLDPERPPWEDVESIGLLQNQTWMNQSWMKEQLDLAKEIYEEALEYTPTPAPTSSPTPSTSPTESPLPSSPHPSKKRSNVIIGSIAAVVIVAVLMGVFLMRKGYPKLRQVEKVDERLKRLDEALLDGRISEETYNELKKKYEEEK